MLSRLYTILYGLVFGLLVIPWVYFHEKTTTYSFLPRRILFFFIAGVALLLIFTRPISYNKFFKFLIFAALGSLHWLLRNYVEPHYLLEFVYLEVALLIFYAPLEIKQKMLKWSSVVLYLVLIKAFFYHMGSYFHGGFLSSNLYALYIVFLCFIEVYRKRYWNLIPSIPVIYLAGSKAAYLAMIILLFFTALNHLQMTKQLKFKLNNFYKPMFVSAVLVFIFTQFMVRSDYYLTWRRQMEPSKAATTQNNMIMYGLSDAAKSEKENEKQRVVLLKTKEMQFRENEISIRPLVTDVNMSVGLRVAQYDYIYSNWKQYFFIGDANEAQKESYGHNPHSAIPDFISRLGLLYFILVLLFYRPLFKMMNLFRINISIIPILAFQPYGFTIGHSIVIFSLVYSLSQVAKTKFSS